MNGPDDVVTSKKRCLGTTVSSRVKPRVDTIRLLVRLKCALGVSREIEEWLGISVNRPGCSGEACVEARRLKPFISIQSPLSTSHKSPAPRMTPSICPGVLLNLGLQGENERANGFFFYCTHAPTTTSSRTWDVQKQDLGRWRTQWLEQPVSGSERASWGGRA